MNMTSRMYVNMCENFVDAINKGSVPVIQNAWENILENECIEALNEGINVYDEGLKENFMNNNKAYSNEDIFQTLNELRDKALNCLANTVNVRERNED